jgi:hypothetical protein
MAPRSSNGNPSPNLTLDELEELFETTGFRLRERSLWNLRAVHAARRMIAEVEDEKECGYRVRLICVGRVYDFLPGDIHTISYILGDAFRWDEMSPPGGPVSRVPDVADPNGGNGE